MDRSHFTTSKDIVHDLWSTLSLPSSALSDETLEITGPEHTLPSSYRLSLVPPAAIATSTLAASLIYSLRYPSNTSNDNNDNNNGSTIKLPKVKINTLHATTEYKSESHIQLLLNNPTDDPSSPSSSKLKEIWSPVSGSYKTSDGGVIGIHANFPNHAVSALEILGLPTNCTDKSIISDAVKRHKAIDLENIAHRSGAVMYSLRSPLQWKLEPQSSHLPKFPIIIRKIGEAPSGLPPNLRPSYNKNNSAKSCLSGLRVAEISRVLAGPICGRTLAAHGADVLWIHGPHLPSLPGLDIDTSRGKRSTFLDLREENGEGEKEEGRNKLQELLSSADVFIQSFRPGALAAKGFSPEEVALLNPNGIIYASLNAFGESGPWKDRRGFDSMVQLCSGVNVSEAEYFNLDTSENEKKKKEEFMKWPCQALDHTAGYFLAIGILAALYRRIVEGGSWEVHVSLAGVMEYITSLGRINGKEGFEVPGFGKQGLILEEFMETKESMLGLVKGVKHAGRIEGVEVGYRYMPTKLGYYEAAWVD
ncbi:hypothetical protein TWF970_001428 [Orbilia oligospora]|uniref:Uncharacterized protein n=1 Tax=Orbilia oligospora TaxID=2813651 RepID=A0A7C8VI71_ORBOL|nr:hypothetical protein TWF970_001428 [Orbilia oligospora]